MFNSRLNEYSLAPQFKWLEYTFKCRFRKHVPLTANAAALRHNENNENSLFWCESRSSWTVYANLQNWPTDPPWLQDEPPRLYNCEVPRLYSEPPRLKGEPPGSESIVNLILHCSILCVLYTGACLFIIYLSRILCLSSCRPVIFLSSCLSLLRNAELFFMFS